MNLFSAWVASAALLFAWQNGQQGQWWGKGQWSRQEQKDFEYGWFTVPEGHFRCELPTSWRLTRDKHEEERTHCYGFFLVGPRQATPLPPTISVRYFAPDNAYFRDAEHYLKRQLEPGLIQLAGETTSPPQPALLDAREATTFIRDTYDFIHPESIDAEKIPLREEYYVLPYKGGFVVVIYKAPFASYDYWRPALKRLVDTFRFLPENSVITVRTPVVGLEAEEVEEAATLHLEAALDDLTGLKDIRSVTYRDECDIWLLLQHDVDVEAARREIDRLLATVKDKLPPDAVPVVEPPAGDEPQILLVALCSADESRPRELTLPNLEALADRVVRDRLAAVPGVADVQIVGGGPRYEVVPALDQLAAKNVSIDELAAAVRQAAETARYNDPPGDVPESPEELLRGATVTARDGQPVRLGDLARVRIGRAHGTETRIWLPDETGARLHSPAAVLLAVRTLGAADAGAVYRAADRVLDQVRSELPDQVRLVRHVFNPVDVGALMQAPADDQTHPLSQAIEQAVDKLMRLEGVTSIWRLDPRGEFVLYDGEERAQLLIEIDPSLAPVRDELLDLVRSALVDSNSLVSVGNPVSQPGQFPGVFGEMTAILTGPDLEIMRREAEGIVERLNEIPGTIDVQLEPAEPGLSFQLTPDHEAAKRYAFDSPEALSLVGSIANRRSLAKMPGPSGRSIDVVMMVEGNESAQLARLPLRTKEEAIVTLDRVAEISTTDSPQAIFHQNAWRAIVIGCNIRNRQRDAAFSNIRRFCEFPHLPGAYSLECRKAD